MRVPSSLPAILLCAGLGQVALAPAGLAAAPAPSRDSANEMMATYEDFCLGRFPDPARIKEGVAARHLAQATPADRTQFQLGGAGDAWVVVAPHGRFVLAMAPPPRQGCAVVGDVLNDEATQAAFEAMVAKQAASQQLGSLTKPPLRHGMVNGRPAVMQLIGALPEGRPRQAFVNLAVGNPDGTSMTRLRREFAPAPAAPPIQPNTLASPMPAAPPASPH